MSKATQNSKIATLVSDRIDELGYGGKLEIDPIPNAFKRRNNYTQKDDGTCVFTIFMWQMNALSENELRLILIVELMKLCLIWNYKKDLQCGDGFFGWSERSIRMC
ncbi:hypothetical protein ACN077_24610 [Clostridium chromiireducens]|uniref:hypothetical protein n=1 Tax=Clostridium chromiireducens TaxID=225345 RepID=UPI003AF834A3